MSKLKCFGKNIYDKKTAITAKNRRWEEGHIALREYPCNLCGYWHLTSKDPYRNEKKQRREKVLGLRKRTSSRF